MTVNLINQIMLLCKPPLGKKPRCIFTPKKSLEEVVDVLKGKVSPALAIELNQGFSDKPTVKKNRKRKTIG
jgi:hypothetical protein